MYTVCRKFRVDASHQLDHMQIDHPTQRCVARKHGHRYEIEIIMKASELTDDGFVRNLSDLGKAKSFLDTVLDHNDLNSLIDGRYTTCECLSVILFAIFQTWYPEVCGVKVGQSPRMSARYDGPLAPKWAKDQAQVLLAAYE